MHSSGVKYPETVSTGPQPEVATNSGVSGTTGTAIGSFDGRSVEERIREMKEAAEHASKLRMQEMEFESNLRRTEQAAKAEQELELSLKKRKREAEIDEETQERKERAAEDKAMKKMLANEQASKEVKEAEDAKLQAIEEAEYVEKAKEFQNTMKKIINGANWSMRACKPLQEGFLTAYLDYHKLEYSSDERTLFNCISPAVMGIMTQPGYLYEGREEDEPMALAFVQRRYPQVGATNSDRVKFYVAGYLALLRTFSDPFMIGKW